MLRPEYAPSRLQPHLARHLVLIIAVGAEVGLVAPDAVVDGLEVVSIVHQFLRGRQVPLPGHYRLLLEARAQPLLQRLKHLMVWQLRAVRVPVVRQPVVPRVFIEEDLREAAVLADEAGGRPGVGQGLPEGAGRLVEVVLVNSLVHRKGPLMKRQIRYR